MKISALTTAVEPSRSEASFVLWWAGIGLAVWIFGEGFATLGCCLAYLALQLLSHTIYQGKDHA